MELSRRIDFPQRRLVIMNYSLRASRSDCRRKEVPFDEKFQQKEEPSEGSRVNIAKDGKIGICVPFLGSPNREHDSMREIRDEHMQQQPPEHSTGREEGIHSHFYRLVQVPAVPVIQFAGILVGRVLAPVLARTVHETDVVPLLRLFERTVLRFRLLRALFRLRLTHGTITVRNFTFLNQRRLSGRAFIICWCGRSIGLFTASRSLRLRNFFPHVW